jgi:hypothetical protein
MEHTQRTSHSRFDDHMAAGVAPCCIGHCRPLTVVHAAMYVSSACGNVNAFAAQVELQVGCAGAL